MDDEPVPVRAHTLGDDISRLSVRDLEALRAALIAEAERVAAEVGKRSATRNAADAMFRRPG